MFGSGRIALRRVIILGLAEGMKLGTNSLGGAERARAGFCGNWAAEQIAPDFVETRQVETITR